MSQITSRERDVIRGACEGLTDKQMASKLGIATATITTYWERIRSKTDCPSRTAVVAKILTTEFEGTIAVLRLEISDLRRGRRLKEGAA